MGRMVALLRAVNVGGRKLPMAELRALCAELGWEDVATYIQSGNVVFTRQGQARGDRGRSSKRRSRSSFGLDVPVIVRTAAEWAKLSGRAIPFRRRRSDEPNRLHAARLEAAARRGRRGELIEARAKAGEQRQGGGRRALVPFPEGVGASKLTPALIDKRRAARPRPARNYNTVMKLREMLG